MTTATLNAEVETTDTADTAAWVATPEWILAGNATWTVSNASGQHYTFRTEKGKRPNVWFLSVLNGPDNESDYGPLGVLRADGTVGNTRLAVNGRSLNDSKARKVAEWALKVIWGKKELPAGYGINHAGCCGRCGRTLTRPEGVDPKGYRFGYGPKCWDEVMKNRAFVVVAPAPQQPAAQAGPVHPANRVESAAERLARANREAIEAEDEAMGANPMY